MFRGLVERNHRLSVEGALGDPMLAHWRPVRENALRIIATFLTQRARITFMFNRLDVIFMVLAT